MNHLLCRKGVLLTAGLAATPCGRGGVLLRGSAIAASHSSAAAATMAHSSTGSPKACSSLPEPATTTMKEIEPHSRMRP